jgi:hypothetical protein
MHDMHDVNRKKPEFRFRLNGVIIPELRIERAQVNGEPVRKLQIAAFDSNIGWIVVDDNAHLPDKHLSRFVLEYRNETEWAKIDPVVRRSDSRKGWHRVSPRKLMKVLHEAGLIHVDLCELEGNN